MSAPPLLPPQESTTWSQRNWKWFVPTLAVGAPLVMAGCVFLFLHLLMVGFRSNGAYEQSMALVQGDPRAISALGEPISAGYWTQGNVRMSGPSGVARLSIPLRGSVGEGTLHVEATKRLGDWQLDAVVLQIEGDGRRIALVPARPIEQ